MLCPATSLKRPGQQESCAEKFFCFVLICYFSVDLVYENTDSNFNHSCQTLVLLSHLKTMTFLSDMYFFHPDRIP